MRFFSPFQVILVLKEQNNFGEIESLAHRACRLYQQQGSPEAAGQFFFEQFNAFDALHFLLRIPQLLH